MLHSASPGSAKDEHPIHPSQLTIGMFVRLKLGWVSHPFMFNQFRITHQEQIDQIQELDLEQVHWVPSRSTSKPAPVRTQTTPETSRAPPSEQTQAGSAPPDGASVAPLEDAAAQVAPDSAEQQRNTPSRPDQAAPSKDTTETPAEPAEDIAAPAARGKAERARRIAEQRARIAACERRYTSAARDVRNLMHGLHANPGQSVTKARDLVGGIVDSFSTGDIVIHLMNEKLSDETAYFHVINVMVLSLLLGKELKLPPELLNVIGEGALFHDIGKLRIPDTVLRNAKRNRHEEEFYRLHTVYGRELARELGTLTPAVCDIIESHHETMDGKGYPKGLKGAGIPMLARIVAIANHYDNLCNPQAGIEPLTPASALARMFRDEAGAWDQAMLTRFIRLLGVYPPGSLVQLSNGNIGIVVSVNHADLLRPSILLFDPAVPKEEAIVIDLVDTTDTTVDFVMKPADLEPDALRYLSPRRRMSYFHSTQP